MKIHRILPVRRSFARAFTLIELLIVIAIIGVLAALSIGSFTMATKSAARNRTTATLQAIVGALERYKADNGEFPEPASSSTPLASDSKYHVGGALMLYQAITGDGNDQIKLAAGSSSAPSSGTVNPANKQYIINGDFIPSESSPGSGTWRSKLNATMKTSDGFWLMDGFGHPFQYEKAAAAGAVATTVNSTYDVWSFGDVGAADSTDATYNSKSSATHTATWIKNW